MLRYSFVSAAGYKIPLIDDAADTDCVLCLSNSCMLFLDESKLLKMHRWFGSAGMHANIRAVRMCHRF